MNVEKAGMKDIESLVRMRTEYLAEDNGGLDDRDLAAIQRDLPGYFRAHLDKDLFVYVIRDGQEIVSCAFLLLVEKPMSPAFIRKDGTNCCSGINPAHRPDKATTAMTARSGNSPFRKSRQRRPRDRWTRM